MTIEKLFAYVSKVKPHAFDNDVLLRWTSECEGMIQSEILLLSPDDVITYESVDATKTVTVTVTADADATSDRTKDRALLTVRDASGDCVLDLTESELLCGEKKTFTLKDASTGSSKTVEAERKASDDAIAPGAVTLTVTVGSSSPVVTAVTPAAPSWDAAASASGLCPITLLVPAPYDRMYYAYLEAMIDYQEGEYNGYANTLERFNAEWSEYSRWVGDNIRPALGRAEFKGYYLSAYAIAVKHGYAGSEAEWAELLIAAGEHARQAHEDAASASASATAAAGSATAAASSATDAYGSAFDAAAAEYNASQSASAASGSAVSASGYANTAGQAKTAAEAAQTASETAQGKAEAAVGHYPRISGETGDWEVWDAENEEWSDTGVNAEGEDGVSPDVEIESITGGHRVTITDADHPSGQAFDVMDGEDGATVTFGTDVYQDLQIAPPGDKLGDTYVNTDTGKHYRWENVGAVDVWRYKGTIAPYVVKRGTVTLSTSWTDAGSGVYTQSVTISGATANSQFFVEYPDATVLQMIDDGVSIIKIENVSGTLTAKCIGAALTASVDVTYTKIETEAAS